MVQQIMGGWRGAFERNISISGFLMCMPPQISTPTLLHAVQAEKTKKMACEQRIVEMNHSSFTPLAMSSTGGHGQAVTTLYIQIPRLLLATKGDQCYSTTMSQGVGCRSPFCALPTKQSESPFLTI